MLIIRKEQLPILGKTVRDHHIDSMAEVLKRHWPGRAGALDPGAFRELVAAIVSEAEGYGVKTRDDILRYANLTFLWGRDFAGQPGFEEMAGILRNQKLAGPVKMSLLMETTRVVIARSK